MICSSMADDDSEGAARLVPKNVGEFTPLLRVSLTNREFLGGINQLFAGEIRVFQQHDHAV